MAIKKRIGLLVADASAAFYSEVTRGAMTAAEENNAELLIIPGKDVMEFDPYDPESEWLYQYNTLYTYACAECVDVAAVCLGSICAKGDSSKPQELLGMIGHVPVLTVSDRKDGLACIQYDNTSGILESIRYLVKNKNCTKIGMLTGPASVRDAIERLDAYKEGLDEQGIIFEERYVAYGTFRRGCVDEAARLIDTNPELEAIICANDEMAHAVYQVLNDRDIEIGRKMYVVGFDDAADSSSMMPPLATIRADEADLGYETVRMALRIADGENPESKYLKTKFILRESAGYRPYDAISSIERQKKVSPGVTYDVNAIADVMSNFIFKDMNHDYQAECQKKIVVNFFQHLLARYLNDVVRKNQSDDILHEFIGMIDRGAMKYVDMRRLFHVFDTVYHIYCEKNMTLSGRMELHDLIAKFEDKAAAFMSMKVNDVKCEQNNMMRVMNWVTRDIMSARGCCESQYADILRKVGSLGISESYLYIWEEPQLHRRGDVWHSPDQILLKSFQQGREAHHVPRTLQKISTSEITDNRFMCGRESSWIMMDLFDGDEQIGIYLCSLPFEYFRYYTFINNQLNIAVSRIHDAAESSRLRRALGVSKYGNTEAVMDGARGITDRETFVQKITDAIHFIAESSKEIIICYIDIDNLKNVNELFGRSAGNDILVECAEISETIEAGRTGYVAAAGYMGSDEFAILIIENATGMAAEYKNAVDAAFDKMNDRVFVSAAAAGFRYHRELEAEDMLNEAMDMVDEERHEKEKEINAERT